MNFRREGKRTEIPSEVWLAPRGTATYEKFKNNMRTKICDIKNPSVVAYLSNPHLQSSGLSSLKSWKWKMGQ